MRTRLLTLLLCLGAACDAPSSPHPAMPGMPPPPSRCTPSADYPPPPYAGAVGSVPQAETLVVGGVSPLRQLQGLCTPRGVLVIRAFAAWCGPCQEAARHTGDLLQTGAYVLDLLVRDRENRPATAASLPELQPFYDQPPTQLVAPDNWNPWLVHYGISRDGTLRLPLVVIIDRETMKAAAVIGSADSAAVVREVRRILAGLRGEPAPSDPAPPLVDGRFPPDQWAMIQRMRLTGAPRPLDPTNKYDGNASAISFGRLLFHDETLSPAGPMSCAKCHDQARGWQDGLPTARGLNAAGMPVDGDRKTPSLIGAAPPATGPHRYQFRDGRCDSRWCQALGPFEADREYATTRLHVVRAVLGKYPGDYSTVFGQAPDLSSTARFPLDAKPEQPAWDGMAPADQQTINRAWSNLGKALAAYVGTIRPLPVALDRYAGGDLSALTEQQKDGLAVFFQVGCIQCHHGEALSDGSFHSMYQGTGRRDGQPDLGRLAGLPSLLANPFRGDGLYSDDRAAATWLVGLKADPSLEGQFRTPSLRAIAGSAPYFHGGTAKDLPALVDSYRKAGLPDGDAATQGVRDLFMVRFLGLSPEEVQALVSFLETLTADSVDG